MIERCLYCLVGLLLLVTVGAFVFQFPIFSALSAIAIIVSLLLMFVLGVYLGKVDSLRPPRTASEKHV